jgi:hypothetical protein
VETEAELTAQRILLHRTVHTLSLDASRKWMKTPKSTRIPAFLQESACLFDHIGISVRDIGSERARPSRFAAVFPLFSFQSQ